jgi:hypothetical protein
MGPLPTCGDNTRGEGQHVLVAWHDNLDDGGAVEADKINVARKPSGKGLLMVRALTTQIAARHMPWQPQQQVQQVTQKFLWGFLGVFQAHPYTVTQPHGAFSFPVAGDTHPEGITTRVAIYFLTKTV